MYVHVGSLERFQKLEFLAATNQKPCEAWGISYTDFAIYWQSAKAPKELLVLSAVAMCSMCFTSVFHVSFFGFASQTAHATLKTNEFAQHMMWRYVKRVCPFQVICKLQ